MKAFRAHARGGPDQLVYEDAPRPSPGPGEALIEVHASGITFAELTWDPTWVSQDGKDRTPTIPSHEVSGVVTALGEGATHVATGDEVFALIDFYRDGAAAEYVTVPAADIALRPRSVSHVASGASPLAALTAWQALVDHGRLHPGDRVLVQGGAGGVGTFTVQLAAMLGAHVTATARAADLALVRDMGAEVAIDFERETVTDQSSDYDVVVDTVGGSALEDAYSLLRPGGRLITLSAPPSKEKADARGIEATFFIVEPNRDQLGHVSGLIDGKKLLPVVAQTFPLTEGRRRLRRGT